MALILYTADLGPNPGSHIFLQPSPGMIPKYRARSNHEQYCMYHPPRLKKKHNNKKQILKTKSYYNRLSSALHTTVLYNFQHSLQCPINFRNSLIQNQSTPDHPGCVHKCLQANGKSKNVTQLPILTHLLQYNRHIKLKLLKYNQLHTYMYI